MSERLLFDETMNDSDLAGTMLGGGFGVFAAGVTLYQKYIPTKNIKHWQQLSLNFIQIEIWNL